jgi:undecaprenyl-diphosphatase
MPEWLVVILLGAIEGVTEFLPISSTGHLLLAERWLPRQTDLFNIVIQSGAVLAVLFVFTKRAKQLFHDWRQPATRDYLLKLSTAFVITAIGGVLLKATGFKLPAHAAPVAWATFIGGVLILIIEAAIGRRKLSNEITWTIAIAVAVGQLVAAAFPGASRSGTTILFALVLGLNRPLATEFSFLLGIPTLLAAGGLEIFSALRHAPIESIPWNMILLGTIASAVTAFIAVKWLLRFVQTHTFMIFGWYRIALGAVILIWIH